jgi:hypothetical protein
MDIHEGVGDVGEEELLVEAGAGVEDVVGNVSGREEGIAVVDAAWREGVDAFVVIVAVEDADDVVVGEQGPDIGCSLFVDVGQVPAGGPAGGVEAEVLDDADGAAVAGVEEQIVGDPVSCPGCIRSWCRRPGSGYQNRRRPATLRMCRLPHSQE